MYGSPEGTFAVPTRRIIIKTCTDRRLQPIPLLHTALLITPQLGYQTHCSMYYTRELNPTPVNTDARVLRDRRSVAQLALPKTTWTDLLL
ncbi:hypothetical protein EVAR_24723_1 [Eumeta japonica]|uniref:Uncharacterized protein n=1 Tax=Eumeta variegata TaxID=151549 RepID=A0A4C1VDW2_EUMVA|nr:hypothetical protein EVAR_24723_1 [Eumeta japonica]